jgi:hypothetical protein
MGAVWPDNRATRMFSSLSTTTAWSKIILPAGISLTCFCINCIILLCSTLCPQLLQTYLRPRVNWYQDERNVTFLVTQPIKSPGFSQGIPPNIPIPGSGAPVIYYQYFLTSSLNQVCISGFFWICPHRSFTLNYHFILLKKSLVM